MSKELEALERIEDLAFDSHMGEGIIDELELLKQALTPPTEKEVCDVLSYYFYKCVGWENINVEYDKTNKSFTVEHDDDKQDFCKLINNNILFYTDCPIFLVTMISRFYEKESERDV